MVPTGDETPAGASRVSRLLRSPAVQLAAPFVLVAMLFAADLAGGRAIRIGGLMVAVPALSAVFLGPVEVLAVAMITTACIVWAAQDNAQVGTESFAFVMATVVLISVGAVTAAAVRRRRERQLAQSRWVAAMTQRVLLRPLPRALGPVVLASAYMAAEEESAIGGDLYAAARLPGGGVRLMVGDVQGKGLAAVEVAGFLLTVFRRAARRGVALPDLPAYLDRGLREDLTDLDEVPLPTPKDARAAPRSGPRTVEGFVTAVVADVAADGSVVRIANCGHPPPVVLRDGRVHHLEPAIPALPLGLGDLAGDGDHEIDTFPLAPGDILLLYTDGVIETRDATGAFYPFTERLAAWTGDGPEALLHHIRDDLLHYAGTALTDDAALVALQRNP